MKNVNVFINKKSSEKQLVYKYYLFRFSDN